MNILDTIVDHKKEELIEQKKKGLIAPDDFDPGAPRGFRDALIKDKSVAIIAEVKKASPSKGIICEDFDPKKIAIDYEEGGASAISCLTDKKFFKGDISFLPIIRRQVSLPILRKDFIIDHFQVDEAKVWGADAILLIVAVLDDVLLKELFLHAKELGLDALVEVHDPYELERAIKAEVDLIGVNNRNLKDFTCSLDTTFKIKEILGDELPLVSESGISSAEHIRALYEHGIDAALIGESLMRKKDRVAFLKELLSAGR